MKYLHKYNISKCVYQFQAAHQSALGLGIACPTHKNGADKRFTDYNCWSLTYGMDWYKFHTGMVTMFILPMILVVTWCYVYVYLVAKRHARAIYQVSCTLNSYPRINTLSHSIAYHLYKIELWDI